MLPAAVTVQGTGVTLMKSGMVLATRLRILELSLEHSIFLPIT